MFTGEGAGRALIVTADVALGELVEEPLALFVERLSGYNLAAEIAEVGEPVAGVERELGIDLFAQPLSESGAGTGGGDGDLEISATDDGREVEVAEGWIVDGIADDVFCGGLVKDRAINCRDIGGGDDEKVSCEITFGVFTLMPFELTGGGEVCDAFGGCWSDDRYSCAGGL